MIGDYNTPLVPLVRCSAHGDCGVLAALLMRDEYAIEQPCTAGVACVCFLWVCHSA